MLLLDAVFINNSGGKVLLDYLILSVENTGIEVTYLLDSRIANDHPKIISNKVFYIKASLFNRHQFYRRQGKRFDKAFCFANLPPTIRLKAEVMVYFHQRLFLTIPNNNGILHKLIFTIKSGILGKLIGNADKWIVQSNQMKTELISRFSKISEQGVIIAPFYPPISTPLNIVRKQHSFLYVSGGAPHKNHINLLKAFKIYFDKVQLGELHVTVGEEFELINAIIDKMRSEGYPITNHGTIAREKLGENYSASKFLIYPSYAESFGLGLIEAMDCGCIVIGADLPYLHAVCDTPFVFDPHNVNAIVEAMEAATKSKDSVSKKLSPDNVGEIINLLN